MKRLRLFYFLIVGMSSFASATPLHAASPEQRPITDAKTLIAIYTENQGLGSAGQRQLILAIWGDGFMVWSEDRLHGGAPYHSATIPPKRLIDLLSNLERKGIFKEESLQRSNYAPDSVFTAIQIQYKGRRLEMSSWHELTESRGQVVATKDGLAGLGSQSYYEVLKNQSAEYLLFRTVWSDIRARTAELVPSSGKSIAGRIEATHGNVIWRSDATLDDGKKVKGTSRTDKALAIPGLEPSAATQLLPRFAIVALTTMDARIVQQGAMTEERFEQLFLTQYTLSGERIHPQSDAKAMGVLLAYGGKHRIITVPIWTWKKLNGKTIFLCQASDDGQPPAFSVEADSWDALVRTISKFANR